MRCISRFWKVLRTLELPRILAATLVVFGHVVLVLLLQAAMRAPDAPRNPEGRPESVVALEFLSNPLPAPAVERKLAARIQPQRRRASEPKPTANPSTSMAFLDAAPSAAKPLLQQAPHPVASDEFDPAPTFKPFPQAPHLNSNLPRSVIRLPDRPSMLQAYWAVPEGENLQGKVARKVPLLGLLLVATGAIGRPNCPPKSEHPDCLRRLLDDSDP